MNEVGVATVDYPPYVNPCVEEYPNGCHPPGYDTESLHTALVVMGYTPRYTLVSDSTLLSTFLNGSYNVIGVSFDVMPEEAAVTPPVYGDKVQFLVPSYVTSPEEKDLLLAACGLNVYFALLALLLLSTVPPKIFAKTFKVNPSKIHVVQEVAPSVWWFGLGIFLSVFSSIVTVLLFKPTEKKPLFSSLLEFSQLLESKRCTAVYIKDYQIIDRLMDINYTGGLDHSLEPIVRETLTRAHKVNPPIALLPSQSPFLNLIRTTLASRPDCRIMVTYSTAVKYILSLLGSGAKDFEMIDVPNLPTVSYRFVVQKGTALERDLRYYFSGGSADDNYVRIIEEKMKSRKRKKVIGEFGKRRGETTRKALGILDIAQSIYFLLLMSICSVFLMVFEVISVRLPF